MEAQNSYQKAGAAHLSIGHSLRGSGALFCTTSLLSQALTMGMYFTMRCLTSTSGMIAIHSILRMRLLRPILYANGFPGFYPAIIRLFHKQVSRAIILNVLQMTVG